MRVILKEFKKSQSDILQKQQKSILERTLPESLKLAIARRIENNLFSRVNSIGFFPFIESYSFLFWQSQKRLIRSLFWVDQVPFLTGMGAISEIRTLFAAQAR